MIAIVGNKSDCYEFLTELNDEKYEEARRKIESVIYPDLKTQK